MRPPPPPPPPLPPPLPSPLFLYSFLSLSSFFVVVFRIFFLYVLDGSCSPAFGTAGEIILTRRCIERERERERRENNEWMKSRWFVLELNWALAAISTKTDLSFSFSFLFISTIVSLFLSLSISLSIYLFIYLYFFLSASYSMDFSFTGKSWSYFSWYPGILKYISFLLFFTVIIIVCPFKPWSFWSFKKSLQAINTPIRWVFGMNDSSFAISR